MSRKIYIRFLYYSKYGRKGGAKMKGYRQVSLPDGFYRELQKYAEENDFNSVAELIRTSARAYIRMEVKK